MGSGALNETLRARVVGGVATAAVTAVVVLLVTSAGCGDDTKPRPAGLGAVCYTGTSLTCDGGNACVNSNCTPTCADGGTCPSGEYCENAGPSPTCSAVKPVECTTSTDCPNPQVCTFGLCTSTQLRADGGLQGCITGVVDGGNDACASDAVCLSTVNGNHCIALPHCGEDGTCPASSRVTGAFGSTCNQMPDGGFIFPGKQRLCLFSYCLVDGDCPAKGHCFHRNQADPVGQCNYGQTGDPCYTGADCFNSHSSTCYLADGGVDDGGQLGTCP